MITDKKERIIEAATASFSQFGFKGTTMDSVAKIAKVGKGTVYSYFENKEELFNEIVDRAIKQMMSAGNQALQPGIPLHENIRHVLEAILAFRQNHLFIFKMVQEARDIQTVPVIETIEKIDQEIIDYLKGLIQQQIEKGETIQQDPEFLAFLLFKTYLLLISDWEKHHPPLDSSKITEVLQRQVY
ncbi:TetR/AcrR family transcriptional regulator [Niallia endozanthoxylica]|uniref:TetR/AcrR family transcriptional regulator n=1 Tax=Niallia endozanthoxylica TaxID=2036016 RepID=A0A5J5H6G4_9BACI|nr:TetR/AcrR family transcriptional regulator [Niallia endozanthoxylica]KAA9015518.1 TetR/AcrR family transcriptional regulator [Niallia endozanthoxylica]